MLHTRPATRYERLELIDKLFMDVQEINESVLDVFPNLVTLDDIRKEITELVNLLLQLDRDDDKREPVVRINGKLLSDHQKDKMKKMFSHPMKSILSLIQPAEKQQSCGYDHSDIHMSNLLHRPTEIPDIKEFLNNISVPSLSNRTRLGILVDYIFTKMNLNRDYGFNKGYYLRQHLLAKNFPTVWCFVNYYKMFEKANITSDFGLDRNIIIKLMNKADNLLIRASQLLHRKYRNITLLGEHVFEVPYVLNMNNILSRFINSSDLNEQQLILSEMYDEALSHLLLCTAMGRRYGYLDGYSLDLKKLLTARYDNKKREISILQLLDLY